MSRYKSEWNIWNISCKNALSVPQISCLIHRVKAFLDEFQLSVLQNKAPQMWDQPWLDGYDFHETYAASLDQLLLCFTMSLFFLGTLHSVWSQLKLHCRDNYILHTFYKHIHTTKSQNAKFYLFHWYIIARDDECFSSISFIKNALEGVVIEIHRRNSLPRNAGCLLLRFLAATIPL